MKIACPNCGAKVASESVVCGYCSQNLSVFRGLTEEQEKQVIAYLKSMDRSIKSGKDDLDSRTGISFMILSVIGIAAVVFLFFFVRINLFGRIGLSALVLVLLFVIFGFFANSSEQKGYEKKWESSVKPQILAYMKSSGITIFQLQIVAAEHLSTKSPLWNFLSELGND